MFQQSACLHGVVTRIHSSWESTAKKDRSSHAHRCNDDDDQGDKPNGIAKKLKQLMSG
jgi:hypothetical protein